MDSISRSYVSELYYKLSCTLELHLKFNFQLQFDILELHLWIVIQVESCGLHFQINLRFGTAFKIELQPDIFELHLWIVVQFLLWIPFTFQNCIKNQTAIDHLPTGVLGAMPPPWANVVPPWENLCPRGNLKKLCYIAGKVLKIRPKIKILKKLRLRRAVQLPGQLYAPKKNCKICATLLEKCSKYDRRS